LEDLTPYENYFNTAFPNYNDDVYAEIRHASNDWRDPGAMGVIDDENIEPFLGLLGPLVKIYNFKNTIDFPSNPKEAIRSLINVMNAELGEAPGLNDPPIQVGDYHQLIASLIGHEGIALRTATAYLHFCYPDHFPIIDKNVKKGCARLFNIYPQDFERFDGAPILPPYGDDIETQLTRYQDFVNFIAHVKLLQFQYDPEVTFRKVDKALMVIGKDQCWNTVRQMLGHET
jgi:hypothetical protein